MWRWHFSFTYMVAIGSNGLGLTAGLGNTCSPTRSIRTLKNCHCGLQGWPVVDKYPMHWRLSAILLSLHCRIHSTYEIFGFPDNFDWTSEQMQTLLFRLIPVVNMDTFCTPQDGPAKSTDFIFLLCCFLSQWHLFGFVSKNTGFNIANPTVF